MGYLANGLRKHFSSAAKNTFSIIFAKLKEKKTFI